MSSASSPFARWVGWLPFLATGVVIWLFAVEVPFSDDWDTPGGILRDYLIGNWSWREVFAQHNESRFAVPRLIMLGTSVLSGGFKTVPWMFVTLFFMVLTGLGLRRWGWNVQESAGAWAAALGAMLYCIPTQTENFTWGGQMGLFVPALAIVFCHGVTREIRSVPLQYGLCAALAWIATFCFANGMIVWLLGCPFWFACLRGERRISWPLAAYLGVAVLTIGFYFTGYFKPPAHPSMLVGFKAPVRLMLYFFTWLGGPFHQAVNRPLLLSPVIGVALLALALGMLWQAWQRRRDLPVAAILWLTLLMYGLACGAITSLGRSGFDVQTALAPRYTTFALWIPLATLGLISSLGSPMIRPVGGAILALLILAWPSGWFSLRNRRDHLEQDRLTVLLVDVIPENPLIGRLHPSPEFTTAKIRFFSERGWMPPLNSFDWLRPALQVSDGPYAGSVDGVPGSRGGSFFGWAMNPSTRRPADFVVVAVEDGAGGWRPWTAVRVDRERPDVAKAVGRKAMDRSGFDVSLKAWPEGPWRVLAVDSTAKTAWPIHLPK